jgi:hypothetical protein
MCFSPWIREEKLYVCGEIRAPGPNCIWSGGLFYVLPDRCWLLTLEELQMDRKELAYAKQALPAIKDWDAFQAVIRTWSRVMKAAVAQDGWATCDKKGR